MISLSHLSFVQCEQVKFRPKTQEKGLNKDIHSIVLWPKGQGRGQGENAVRHDMNLISAMSLNLISFTIFNKA